MLVNNGRIKGEALALDSTFIKAYSRRNLDNRTGYSDPESRIGRAVKAKDLGYRLHLAVDVKSELPLAMIVVSANENEKKHAPTLFHKALTATEQHTKTVVADSQFSSRKLREQLSTSGVKVVIPYPANQNKEKKTLLRVDKYFRTHGPACERQIYNQRGVVERVNSRLKEQLCLERHRARGLERITIHALLLNALIALRLNRLEKARSLTMIAR